MKVLRIIAMLPFIAAVFAGNIRGQSRNGAPATVDYVDLERYSGKSMDHVR